MPRAVVVTQLDHQRADFDETVARLPAGRSATASAALPAVLGAEATGTRPAGLIGLLVAAGLRLLRAAPASERDPDPEHLPLIEEARNGLIEGIIAESEDETLMDRYLGGEDIDVETLDRRTWRRRSPAGTFYPVLRRRAAPTGARHGRAARADHQRRSRPRWSTTLPAGHQRRTAARAGR